MTEQSLAGKVAVITGAASPIGMGHSMATATVQASAPVAWPQLGGFSRPHR